MKLLKDILYGVSIIDLLGSTLVAINSVTCDSRSVKKDGLFIAIKGTKKDGNYFIEDAIVGGAVVIVCEELPKETYSKITYIQVKSASKSYSIIAGNWFDRPSEKLNVVGITGTNGKTTTASLLHQLFENNLIKSGLISTIKISIHNKNYPATHTTPDAWEIQRHLSDMAAAGCKLVFIEVSSHGLVQNRVAGIRFKGGIFTNISRDHLDYHKTIDNYVIAKKMLFDNLNPFAFALVNRDDKYGDTMLLNCKAKKISYGITRESDIKARVLESHIGGTLISINQRECWLKVIGDFNVYNACAVYGAAIQLGMTADEALQRISALNAVSGRFQKIEGPNGITGIVDYAHTPDALEKVLSSLIKFRKPPQRIITIVGCGGDRDKGKRPQMASIASRLSDYVILTSDNPRSESAEKILKDMESGLKKSDKKYCISIADRSQGIKLACQNANANDVILLAGKGHEKFQEIHGEKIPFDDLLILKTLLIEAQT